MKKRSYRLYISDILEAMNNIETYVKDLTYETFIQNNMVKDAVLRNLEVIGEAAKNISKDIKTEYAGIPWKRIVGLRNIVIHEYFGVDMENIWKIITDNLPQIKPAFIELLKQLK